MEQNRRGVVLCGAYGMENAGDDAIMQAVQNRLHAMESPLTVTVMTRHLHRTPRAEGVRYLPFWNVPAWFFAMCRARLFLSGGGTLLQDATSRRSLRFYMLTIRLARLAGCAVQLYGCGIGPLSGRARKGVARLLNACADAVTVRDAESLRLLEKIGVTKPRRLLSADPALSLPPDTSPKEPAFGFVLRTWEYFDAYAPAFAAAAEYVWHTYHLKPVFLCMSPSDRFAAETVCERLSDIPHDIRPYGGRMTALISMRLHGLIFALRDRIPAGGVSYDPKVDAFCRDADEPCVALGDVTPERLTALVDGIMKVGKSGIAIAYDRLFVREKINGDSAEKLLFDKQ